MPHKYKEIDGWFDEDFSRIYDFLVKHICSNDAFIEVGCWKGCSSVYLLEKLVEEDKYPTVYFVDTFTGDEHGNGDYIGKTAKEFEDNVISAGFDHLYHLEDKKRIRWQVLPMDSIRCAKMWTDNSIFSIMLDGNHGAQYVAEEIQAWLPKIKHGGYIVGHDFPDQAINPIVNRLLPSREDWGSCYLYRKP